MVKRSLTAIVFCLFAALLLSVSVSAQEQGAGERPAARRPGLPLKAERKIEFTTDEATWLSPGVSPDGKTIVFELLGDLYTVPIAGGEAKKLAVSDSGQKDGSGMAFDSQPRFSPDGQWIAFLSDREGSENVWICKADGTEPKQLTRDNNSEFASPTWTPDGQYVVVSRSGWALRTFEIWMYHIKGGSGVQITKARPQPNTPQQQRHNALGATFSPDGRYIYFSRKQGGFQYNAMFPLWQIARYDRLTGQEDTLVTHNGSAMRPLVSPDGNWLIYATRYETQTGLRIRNLTTGEDRWLKYPVTRDDQESRFTRDLLPGYAFLPDGKEILATWGGKIHRLNIASGADTVVPFIAAVSVELGPRLNVPYKVDQGPVRARLIQDPALSPDSKWLAFSAISHMYVADASGGTPRRLTSGDAREYQPTWSPDGQWVAYVTWATEGCPQDCRGAGHIWKMRADGSGQPMQLSRTAAYYSDLAWAPDGARIVALRGSAYNRLVGGGGFGGGGLDVVWIPAQGGEATLIIPSRGLGRPHFTNQEGRIYFYSNQGLVSLRWDGTDRRSHLRVTGTGNYNAEEPVPASNARVSPDGKWVLAHVMNQLYLLALPMVGGDTAPTVNVNNPTVPIKKLTDIGADYFDWADEGKTITWVIGSSFFRQPADSVTFDPPRRDAGGAGGGPPAGSSSAEACADESPECAVETDRSAEGEAAQQAPAQEAKKPSPVKETEFVVEVPRKMPKGSIVLRGATVITMKGDEVITDADVVVTDNRIAAVGKRGGVKVPAGATILDAKGKTIVPGFVDTHAHWGEIRRGVLDLQAWPFLANLAYGVTAGLDVQTGTNDMLAYQDLIDAGEMIGPRNYSTGPGIFSNNAFRTLDEAKGVLTRYKKYYRTRNLKSYIVGNRRQRQFMVEASKELEMMPTTEGGLDLKLDLTHVIDGMHGNEHTLPIAPLYKDVVELVAQSKIAYTPTLIVAYGGPWAENWYYQNTEVHDDAKLNRFTPHNVLDGKTQRRPAWFRKAEYAFPQHAQDAGKILRAGGYVGVGAHGQIQGIGYHWEMWNLASGGWKPLEVLRAATISGANIIGLADDIGSIEPGKLADLVVLDKNPLDDIHNTNTVRWVMKNGELFEGETLNQIWPEKKPLPPLWWWSADKPGTTAP